MIKILITGGAGFIGSHTAVALHENGYLPVILDNFSNSERSVLDGLEKITGKKFPCYEGDCTDTEFVRKVFDSEDSIKGVIHFVAYKSVFESMNNPQKYYSNNLGSLTTLLGVMIERGVSDLVFSSSCTVYGSPDQSPIDETAPFKDTPSPYGKTKQICENILKDMVEQKAKIKCAVLRYFNPIGAHSTGFIGELPIGVPDNLVPYVTQTAAGLRERLTIFGDDYNTPDGSCVRDYIHVMDLAGAHVKAFEYLKTAGGDHCCEAFNVGTGKGASVKEVVQTFEEVNGVKLNYTVGRRRLGDVESVYAHAGKANKVMNWSASLPLTQALKDAWNWQQQLSKK